MVCERRENTQLFDISGWKNLVERTGGKFIIKVENCRKTHSLRGVTHK